ncbi:MAG TPA: hypothetical protein VGL56_13790 [Fimbriimonadaceae bacterium]|jgi:hypothetical protein
MLELSIRLLFAGFVFMLSAWVGAPDLSIAWKLSLFVGAYAGIGHLIETRRGRIRAVTATYAICDAATILFVGAGLHQTQGLALCAVLPAIYANRTHRLSLWATLPAVAILTLAAGAVASGGTPPIGIYFIALAMVGAAYLLKEGVNTGTQPIPEPIIIHVPKHAAAEIDADAFLLLRENFRKVKERYVELEKDSKKDHALAELFSCKVPSSVNFHTRIAEKIAQLCGADSVAIYTLAQFGNRMVVRGTAGANHPIVEDSSYAVDLSQATRQITDKVELSTRAMLTEGDRAKVATVLLMTDSKVVGMLNLFHTEWNTLLEAKRLAEDLATSIAWIITDQQKRTTFDRRLHEMEVLYETAAISTGSTNRHDLADRVTRRLAGVVSADFVGTYLLEDGVPKLVSHCGVEVPCLDCMSFATGSGFEGWLNAGAPEVAVFHPGDDQRCETDVLLRRRIGGFFIMPLQFQEMPFGFMVAASRASGALEASDLAALRAISCEFAQAVCRIELPNDVASGLVTPTAFQGLAGGARPGCLIFFELLKRQQFKEVCEPNAVREGLRAFSLRLRGKLTAGGAATQKAGGDFVAFLPNASAEFAASWANDVAATASMIGVATTSGKKTIPLAFRARVADLTRQSNEVLDATAV